jgi:hypothetical protein
MDESMDRIVKTRGAAGAASARLAGGERRAGLRALVRRRVRRALRGGGAPLRGRMVPTQMDAEIAAMQKPYEGMAFDFFVERIEPESH